MPSIKQIHCGLPPSPSHKAVKQKYFWLKLLIRVSVTKGLAAVWCVKCSHQMCLHIIHNNLTVFFLLPSEDIRIVCWIWNFTMKQCLGWESEEKQHVIGVGLFFFFLLSCLKKFPFLGLDLKMGLRVLYWYLIYILDSFTLSWADCCWPHDQYQYWCRCI